MGEKGAFLEKLEQDVVAKGRIFPLFPQSFQHLTPTIHIGCGKKPPTTRFNTSSTTHSQPRGKSLPRMKPDTFRLFNIFPTPYYGYYNKFNIQKAVLQPFHVEDFLNKRIQNKERR